jgi:UDP-glucose 4-epimerase
VREVIREVERVAGRRIPTRDSPRRPGDPHVLVAASEHAAQLLGWRPRYCDLRTIVKTAWRWHRSLAAAPRVKSAA